MNRFELARFEAGLTVTEAAEQAGLDPSAVSRIENGRRRPNARQTKALSEAYGKSVAWLLEVEGATA